MDSQNWMELLDHNPFNVPDDIVFQVVAYSRGQIYADRVYFREFVRALTYYRGMMLEHEDVDYIAFSVIAISRQATPLELLNRTGFAISNHVIFDWRKTND